MYVIYATPVPTFRVGFPETGQAVSLRGYYLSLYYFYTYQPHLLSIKVGLYCLPPVEVFLVLNKLPCVMVEEVATIKLMTDDFVRNGE
jgi:hypothetical protein